MSAPARHHKAGTLGALATDFMQAAEFANLKPSSQATYRLALSPVLKDDGHRLVRDLPGDKARKIIQEIGEHRPGMANLTRAVLRRLFAYAIDVGQRRDNPFDRGPEIQARQVITHGRMPSWMHSKSDGRSARVSGCLCDPALHRATCQRRGADAAVGHSQGCDSCRSSKDRRGTLHRDAPRTRARDQGRPIEWHLSDRRSERPSNKAGALSDLIAAAVKAAGLPKECVAHGLRKAALRRLAEHGSTSKQIQAVSGHRTLNEIERYTERADQQRLARAAIGMLPDKD